MRIEEFSGDRRRYLKWRRAIEAQEQLYRLDAPELTMLVYLSTRGEARDVLDQVPLSDLTAVGGNVLLWKLMDESFGESCAELFERAERELSSYRRVPGQPIATYLANMRRLRAQYVRVDPDTHISDRAWAQRLLNRASLSKQERLDVYYSTGGAYTTQGIESALRHRCAQTHEDERRVPAPSSVSGRSTWSTRTPSSRTSSTTPSSATSPRRAPAGKGYQKRNSVHLAEEADDGDEEDLELEGHPAPGGEDDEEGDEDELPEDDPAGEDDDVEHPPSGDDVTAEEVCEAFAAGWKAKAKTAGNRKARGWTASRTAPSSTSKPSSSSSARSLADKKKATTCSSCGLRGHWRGDPQCANVIAGRDPPHRRPENTTREVNFTNFTFVVNGAGDGTGAMAPPASWTTCPTCPSCFAAVTADQKFCRECGTKLTPKREWEFVNQSQEEQPTRPMRDVRLPKAVLGRTSKPREHTVKVGPLEAMAALDTMAREDKKHLRYLLEHEEEQQDPRDQLPIRRGSDYDPGVSSMASATPWQASTVPLAPTVPTARPPALQPPSKKDSHGRDKAEGARKRELEEFRMSLWQHVHEVLSSSSETSAPKDPHFFSDFGEAARKRKVEYWLGLLESDLGVKVITDLPDAEETPTERSMASSRTELRADGGSDGDTITSHEFGLEIEEEEETEPSEASDEELVPDLGGKPCFFHKGLRQRVKQVARDIHLAALGQLDSRMNACQGFFEDASRAPEMSSVKRTRRPGPWRMVEIFTWTMVVGMAACAGNWEVGEPSVEPGFNILETADQERANQYLKAFDPDFMMISYPGCCWEPLLSNEACDPKRCAEKGRERNTQRPILAWIQHVVLELRKNKDVAILGEASYQSDVWREPVVIDTWCGMSTGRSELCAFGLRRPDNEWGQGRGLPLRRPIRLVGTHDIVKNACQACPGNHRHAPSLGGVCVSGQWCPLDGFCGGYGLRKGGRWFSRKTLEGQCPEDSWRRLLCDPYGG